MYHTLPAGPVHPALDSGFALRAPRNDGVVCSARCRPISRCHTAKRNHPRPSSAPRVAVVFPPWHGGPWSPRKAEGAERRLALPVISVRVPLAKGMQRLSALRTAVYGLPGSVSRIDGAFSALALS